jgi:hypothetical protein
MVACLPSVAVPIKADLLSGKTSSEERNAGNETTAEDGNEKT